MAKILDMPKLSPTMEEGVLSTWHKKEGDSVQVDDLLAEVETDKATMEFRAFDKGTLLKILIAPGTQVKLGQAVAIVGNPGDDVQALVAKAGGASVARVPEIAKSDAAHAALPTRETPETNTQLVGIQSPKATIASAVEFAPVSKGSALDRTDREWEHELGQAKSAIANGRPMASPYVRKTARDRGINLMAIHGSGPGGRIVAGDLEQSKAAAPIARVDAPTHTTTLAAPDVRPLSMMRKTIARRLTESKQTVPHFYLTIDVDAGELSRLREEINAELADATNKVKKSDPEAKPLKVSLNDLLIKACATALVRVPECNAQFSPDAILIQKRVDISVAVAIPDGLVTPVVRDADRKSVVRIAEEVRDLAARARAKKLKPEDMADGTFSISNLGMFGIDSFSAVINPPEGAILAVGQARDEPVVRDGQIVAGKKMALTLSCDHRVVDGAVGAAFLAELRNLLERPMRILTG
jgi:pyruvate dehydrogenase E2 component (dihydrolipoamide acetyltransferase)